MSIYYIAEVEVGVESCIGASVEFKNPTQFTTQYLILIKADEVKDEIIVSTDEIEIASVEEDGFEIANVEEPVFVEEENETIE